MGVASYDKSPDVKAALDEVEWDDEDSDEIRQRKGT